MNRDKYKWVILFSGMMICASIGIYISCSSVFVVPVCSELGFDRGEYSLIKTIVSIVSALLSPTVARFAEKYSVKKMLIVSTLLGSLSYVGYSFSERIWQFMLISLICGITGAVNSFLVVGIIVNRWFTKGISSACGIAYCGSGLGAALVIASANKLIYMYGWRMTYVVLAVFGLVLLLPIIIFLLKDYPEGQDVLRKNTTESSRDHDTDLSETWKSRTFRKLATSLVIVYAVSVCANTHTIAYLQDEGHSASFSAGIMSFVMIIMMLGKIIIGIMYDKVGSRGGNIIVGLCDIIYPFISLFAENRIMAVVYGALYGLGSTVCSVPVPILVQEHFGEKSFSEIFGRINMLSVIAGAVLSPVMGYSFDYFGTYKYAWVFLTAISAFAVLNLWSMGKKDECA